MMFLNNDFFMPNGLLSFVDASVQFLLTSEQPTEGTTKYYAHLLYCLIREDFGSNLCSLYGWDIDLDSLGFSLIHRNTRHMFEAYLDLSNLLADPDYIDVMKYCAKEIPFYDGKFNKYKGKRQIFDIPSKCKIAEETCSDEIISEYKDLSRRANQYIHPNVFMEQMSIVEASKKTTILKELLTANLNIFVNAFQKILQLFRNGVQPTLGCANCMYIPPKPCQSCFNNHVNRFKNLIDNGLITYTPPGAGTR